MSLAICPRRFRFGLLACLVLSHLVLVTPPGRAQGLTVHYLDGTALQLIGAAWTVLAIGDSVPLGTSVKVEDHSLLQLKAAGATITIVQPGTYAIEDLAATGASLRAAGVGTAVAAAFSKILRGSGRSAGSAGGVRAETMDAPAPARVPVDTGNDLLAGIAGAYALDGDARNAMAALAAITPTATGERANDYVLLKARLLEDAFAYAPAVELLLSQGAELAADEARAQTWLFLLALGYKGTGDLVREKACLDKVVSMAPESELGEAAALLRERRY